MILSLANGKTYEGNFVGRFSAERVEFTVLKLRPFSRSKYLVIRNEPGQELMIQFITGFDQLKQMLSQIEANANANLVGQQLLDQANHPSVDWKSFYDVHYPHFIFAGMSWGHFRDKMVAGQRHRRSA